MINDRMARIWFGLTSLVVSFGLVVQLIVAARNDEAIFDTVPARVFNALCYFTVESNIIVAITTGLLAVRLRRASPWFRAFRITGLVSIIITGLLFHLLLSDIQSLSGWGLVADTTLHTVSPIMAVLGWLVLGPRGTFDSASMLRALAYPVGWVILTLVRGPIVDFYPYPFIDVRDLGYARVILNLVGITVLFLALVGGAALLDRVLPGVNGRTRGRTRQPAST